MPEESTTFQSIPLAEISSVGRLTRMPESEVSLFSLRQKSLRVAVMTVSALPSELYNSEGKAETVITATRSDFWRKENKLTSDSGILVKRPTLLISANGIDWNVVDSSGTLYTRVRVVLSNSSP